MVSEAWALPLQCTLTYIIELKANIHWSRLCKLWSTIMTSSGAFLLYTRLVTEKHLMTS